MKKSIVVLASILLAVASAGAAPPAAPAAAPAPALAPGPAANPRIVPDRFLRRWDPITVAFPADTGPAKPGPEDDPGRFVRLDPAHPVTCDWLDPRTLRLRPTDPWPPLARFEVTAGAARAGLAVMALSPTSQRPRDGAEGLDPVASIALTLADPVDPDELARRTTIELRPLPGAGRDEPVRLEAKDFSVKALERADAKAPAAYELVLAEPIPRGVRVLVAVDLSPDRDRSAGAFRFSFSTAPPFRAVGLGTGRTRLPLSPGGSRYERQQALRDEGEERRVVAEFSGALAAVDPGLGRSLVAFDPPVAGLAYAAAGSLLTVRGEFEPERVYQVDLRPDGARSLKGEVLEGGGESRVYVWFPAKPEYLRPAVGAAVMERYGPQLLPMEGRGDRKVDLRIHPLDPRDRTFWPFPAAPLVVDESARPPGPGEEPPPHRDAASPVPSWLTGRHLQVLGTPPLSTLVELPLGPEKGAGRFGLDLAPHLAALGAAGKAGTWLVGLRRLDGPPHRAWIRVQVTDLSLAAFEEPESVRFLVTSLRTGLPVADAEVEIEGPQRGAERTWTTQFQGRTGPDGQLVWASGRRDRLASPGRLAVRTADDLLVLDPAAEDEAFDQGSWQAGRLRWMAPRDPPPKDEPLCHLFTERPVYRPKETVHIAGWRRDWARGKMAPASGDAIVGVQGPGDRSWRFPVTLSRTGGFHVAFQEEDDVPTGTYTAWLEEAGKEEYSRRRFASVEFQVETYRVPSFQVVLDAPAETGLDQPFTARLAATWYAGGPVAGRPVQWHVTQHPLDWAPARREGWFYSSDGRYSRVRGLDPAPRFDGVEASDDTGAAEVTIDPTTELDARARLYTIEATVTGDDEQSVTDTAKVRALPPFVLALAVPRWIDEAGKLAPKVLVVGPDGAPRAGQELTVRLVQRQWHSVLQAGDFARGEPRYATDVVDRVVDERTLVSGPDPVETGFDLPRAGVYVVEVEARDKLGRSQVVAVDLFAGGKQAVSWPKPATPVFTVSTDKAEYAPGETAQLVVQSPFQKAQGVAVVEAPDGSRYLNFVVEGGAARIELPVERAWMPRVPVHFLLWRGRVDPPAGAGPGPGDLGKPATMASSLSLAVSPVSHRVAVELAAPERARPGTVIPVTVRLADPAGKPLAGEVALWLVDQAVLSLGREQPLDPLASFMPRIESRLAIHESRNRLFGLLPLELLPGGDGEAGAMPMEEGGILDRATVRKNFKTVPYFEPALAVPASGELTVQVQLPDNLTHFRIRAKAASGADRFGFGTGSVHVRLPLTVQPGLPRFVRPGDRFPALAIARVVEGEAGAGAAELRAQGATLTGPAKVPIAFDPAKPARAEFPLEIPLPGLDAAGRPGRDTVVLTVGAERTADRVSDAFESVLPLLPDRRPRIEREVRELAAGGRLELPDGSDEALPGTWSRQVLVSGEPAMVRMLAALDSLLEYPHGCTEQRLSRSRAFLSMQKLQDVLGRPEGMKELERVVKETLDWLPSAIDGEGLVAYWPGASGYVTVTAWSLQFAVEAKAAGFEVDGNLVDRLERTLTRSLRSDYTRLIDGEAFLERCHALAALAAAGKLDRAYASELARRARYLGLEGKAAVLLALARAGDRGSRAVRDLADSLWDEATFKLHQGSERFAALRDGALGRSPLVLPSAPAALGAMTRALGLVDPTAPRLGLLMGALVDLGRGDGWGSTRADAEALAALVEGLTASPRTGAVDLEAGGKSVTLRLAHTTPLARHESAEPGKAVLVHREGGTLAVRTTRRWLPARSGADEPAAARGFAVSREVTVVEGGPGRTMPVEAAGTRIALARGELLEEHVRVVVPEDSHFVAVELPLAAGVEILNPSLKTAPEAARPSAPPTRAPSYQIFRDDRASFYFDELPAGTYDLYVRTRASSKGSFGAPPARAEKMYDMGSYGTSPGAHFEISGD